MRFLFQLNHPAHYHLFKHAMAGLRARGHRVIVAVRDKDVLLDLVEGEEVVNVAPKYRKSGLASVGRDLLERDRRVYALARDFRPDVMVGTAVEITHAGRLLGIPSVFLGEDDARVVLLGSLACYPFATHLLAPDACDNWVWNRKTIHYRGFQKLAYLHPRYFRPDPARVTMLGESYALIRISALAAYHDQGRSGITRDVLRGLVDRLAAHGRVYISSEKPLEPEFANLRLPTNVHDIHHVLYHARMYIGDSQSMAMEAAMLGVPNIRVSDFVGKIGVLNEVEQRWQLSMGFRPDAVDRVTKQMEAFLADPGTRAEWRARREAMVADKISVTDFLIWFLEEYPSSVALLGRDRDMQLRFIDGRGELTNAPA